jgi:tetratricopeptide (TPR) repeat protein
VASANDANMTADELAVNARSLYTQGKYAEAAALYQKFIADYGTANEAQEAVRQMRYPLAMSLLQMGKYSDAFEEIGTALANNPPLDVAQKQELTFWKGVCEMQDKEYEDARKTLEGFLTMFPPGADRNPNYVVSNPAIQKLAEARLLIGTCLLLDEKSKDAAAYYQQIKGGLVPVNRGRATVLELYALLEAEDNDGAMKLVMEEYPRMGDLLQLVTFQTFTLDLGSRFLEKEEYRKAIICLQRIWSSERLLKHQRSRLAELESKLQAAEANPAGDPYAKFLHGQMITKVRREIENFQKIPNFDSALRLRLATAYQGMGRYRESALIMEAMLRDMPPDKVVESASMNLIQCWNAIERWPKAAEAAETFVEKFPQSSQIPLALYMKGTAEEKEYRYADAVATFENIVNKYPKSEYAPRAQFMKGFSQLLAGQNKDAIASFEELQKKHAKHEMAESAAYWRGMGYSLDKQYVRSREVLDEYLKKYPDGMHKSAAVFRKAYCAQQMKDFPLSIKELRQFLRTFPGAEEKSEARILLADALMNEGGIDEGIAVLKGIPQEDTQFYADGMFKIGRAYKLTEQYDKLREHMEEFQAANARNPRVAEAIYWIGWTYKQADQPDKAREVYWKAITDYGDDAAIRSVEDLFPAVAKLYRGDEEQVQYAARLRDLREEADGSGKKTLAMRALWAQAAALRKKDPAQARAILVDASPRVNVQTANPLLLADFADALLADGREKEGEQMFRDLVKWNPRAPQKDRALATLGNLEAKRGNEKAALAQFDRFERETVGSRLFGQVMLAKAELLTVRGQNSEARATLEKLLANEYSSGQDKAKALYLIGESFMKEGKPDKAIPYYQRIYVMHGRWRDWVAKAYLRSGEAFEKLRDQPSARRTYQELTENEDLSQFQESEQAGKRLKALGGPLPKEESQG